MNRQKLFEMLMDSSTPWIMEGLVRRYSMFYGVSNKRAGTMIRADLRGYLKRLES